MSLLPFIRCDICEKSEESYNPAGWVKATTSGPDWHFCMDCVNTLGIKFLRLSDNAEFRHTDGRMLLPFLLELLRDEKVRRKESFSIPINSGNDNA